MSKDEGEAVLRFRRGATSWAIGKQWGKARVPAKTKRKGKEGIGYRKCRYPASPACLRRTIRTHRHSPSSPLQVHSQLPAQVRKLRDHAEAQMPTTMHTPARALFS